MDNRKANSDSLYTQRTAEINFIDDQWNIYKRYSEWLVIKYFQYHLKNEMNVKNHTCWVTYLQCNRKGNKKKVMKLILKRVNTENRKPDDKDEIWNGQYFSGYHLKYDQILLYQK